MVTLPRISNIVLLVGNFMVGGCVVAQDFQDTCRYQQDVRLSTFGYTELSIEVGFPENFEPRNPHIVLASPSADTPTREIALYLVESDALSISHLDKSQCKDITWRRYMVTFDESAWNNFWAQTDSEHYSILYNFAYGSVKTPAHTFGFAILDKVDQSPIVYCGCYSL